MPPYSLIIEVTRPRGDATVHRLRRLRWLHWTCALAVSLSASFVSELCAAPREASTMEGALPQVQQQAAERPGLADRQLAGEFQGLSAAHVAAIEAEALRSGARDAELGKACLGGHGDPGGWRYDVRLGLPQYIGGCVVEPGTYEYNAGVAAYVAQHGPTPNSSIAAMRRLKQARRIPTGVHRWHGVKVVVSRGQRTRLLLQPSEDGGVCGGSGGLPARFEALEMRYTTQGGFVYLEAGPALIVIGPGGYVTIHDDLAMDRARSRLLGDQLDDSEIRKLCRAFDKEIFACAQKTGATEHQLKITVTKLGSIGDVAGVERGRVNMGFVQCIRARMARVAFGRQPAAKTFDCELD